VTFLESILELRDQRITRITLGLALESRIQTLESELRNERRRRIEAEATLKDIERECREPFVVPKLLQSFVAISKMTGESLQ
jgi:hypothetical protein